MREDRMVSKANKKPFSRTLVHKWITHHNLVNTSPSQRKARELGDYFPAVDVVCKEDTYLFTINDCGLVSNDPKIDKKLATKNVL